MEVTAIAAAAMQYDLQRVDTISQNLANVLTPGYKRQVLSGGSFAAQIDGGLAGAAFTVTLPLSKPVIDPSAAPLRYTGNPLDMAIDGPEFFELATPNGPAYTRQGSFQTDVRGRLVGAQGWPVMGGGGEIVLTGPYTIESNGDVRQGERVVAHLKLVRFDNPQALTPVGSGSYLQGGAMLGQSDVAPTVRVGYQENSNVNSPQEMVKLTETVRHFEAMARVIQGYDDSLEKTIRKLGEF